MKELQVHAECLQKENDQLWVQIEKSRDLGKDVRDSGRVVHPIARNGGKEPIKLSWYNLGCYSIHVSTYWF